jgi:hypothetical protein
VKQTSITRLIFDTVPELYEATAGPFPVQLAIPEEESSLFSAIPLSAELKTYIQSCVAIWEDLRPMTEGEITQIIEREWIQQKFAIAWLEQKTSIKTWPLILDHFQRLSRRTTENRMLSKTVVIEPGRSAGDSARLSDSGYFKVFDWLGSSSFTFFRTDEELGIKGLEAISLTDIKDLESYRFYPDMLHPVISTLSHPDAAVVHLSEKGGLLIAGRNGILASKRVGESWSIYDRDHVIESVGEVMRRQIGESQRADDPTCVACSLFQILFDISMKRHGGLIVLDHAKNLAQYVVKGIERIQGSPLNTIFTHSPFNGLEFSIPEVRKLVELSAVDGALILDLQGNLQQVGSMIISHPTALNHFGTRDAAAYSAARNGATALKVSADGPVSIFFTTPSLTSDEVHRFDFL